MISRSMSSIVAMLRIWLPGQRISANLNAYTGVLAVLLLICIARSTTGIKPGSQALSPDLHVLVLFTQADRRNPSQPRIPGPADTGLQRVWSAQTASPCTWQHTMDMTVSWELGSFRSQPTRGVASRNCMWSHDRKIQP